MAHGDDRHGQKWPTREDMTRQGDDEGGRASDVERSVESAAERTLIDRIRAGDSKAFATLVVQFTDPLTRLAFYMTGSRDVADDLVQRVFIDVWERRATLQPDRLKPYLIRAIRNRVHDEYSANKVREKYRTTTQAEAMAGTTTAVVPSPEDTILTTAVIQAAVQQLPERRRMAIRLRLEDQMTYAEIAEVLEISPVAAQNLIVRGLTDLRKLLWKEH